MIPQETNLITKIILHTATEQDFLECTENFYDLHRLLVSVSVKKILDDFNVYVIYIPCDLGDSIDYDMIKILYSPIGDVSITISGDSFNTSYSVKIEG